MVDIFNKNGSPQKKRFKKRLYRSYNTDGEQLDNTKGTLGEQLDNTKGTLGEQLDIDKVLSYIESLGGKQLKILFYIISNLESEKSNKTINIQSSHLCDFVDVSKHSLKVHIKRLVSKNIVCRLKGKTSKHGYIKFQIERPFLSKIKSMVDNKNLNSHVIYNSNSITTNINKYKNPSDLLQPNDTDKDKIIANLQKQLELQNQRLNHQSQSTTPQLEKDRLTDYINKKLNNIDIQTNSESHADTQDDSEAWTDIDFSSLADYGFKKSHIKQIINANTSLTPQEVQGSIEHYAWALENRREEMKGYAPVSNPLRGLMGVLKKGNAWVEGSYKSPEELALELQIKNKRMQLERQQAKKDELFNIEFEIWYTKLTPEDIAKIEATNGFKSLPIATFNKKMSSEMYRGMMRRHYQENILNR